MKSGLGLNRIDVFLHMKSCLSGSLPGHPKRSPRRRVAQKLSSPSATTVRSFIHRSFSLHHKNHRFSLTQPSFFRHLFDKAKPQAAEKKERNRKTKKEREREWERVRESERREKRKSQLGIAGRYKESLAVLSVIYCFVNRCSYR